MNSRTTKIIVNNIKLPISASFKEAFSVALKRLSKAGINAGEENLKIYRRSVDARNKSDVKYVYSVSCSLCFT